LRFGLEFGLWHAVILPHGTSREIQNLAKKNTQSSFSIRLLRGSPEVFRSVFAEFFFEHRNA
jgi:S-methylmethionine-dependent homocysteine/selenocysteine methylase